MFLVSIRYLLDTFALRESQMSFGVRSLVAVAIAISLCGLSTAEAKHVKRSTVTEHHSASSHSAPSHSSIHHASSGRHGTSAISSTRHSSSVRHSGSRVATTRSSRSSRTARGSSHSHSIIVTTPHHYHAVHHYEAPSYAEPHADNVQNTNSLTSIYHLYDKGVNERLEGRYDDAMKTLLEANNSYTSTQKNLTLEAMINYELGQAAESNNNYSLAADAYGRTLRIKPNMIDASVRLASLLMKAGHPELALSRAREAVAMYPNDPRAHEILSLILEQTGSNADAKVERDSTKTLIKSGSSINTVQSSGGAQSSAGSLSNTGERSSTGAPSNTGAPSDAGVESVPSALQQNQDAKGMENSDSSRGQMSTPDQPKPAGTPIDNDVLP